MISESELFLNESGVPFSLVKVPALFKQCAPPNRLEEMLLARSE
jgi:hypothetical protein